MHNCKILQYKHLLLVPKPNSSDKNLNIIFMRKCTYDINMALSVSR